MVFSLNHAGKSITDCENRIALTHTSFERGKKYKRKETNIKANSKNKNNPEIGSRKRADGLQPGAGDFVKLFRPLVHVECPPCVFSLARIEPQTGRLQNNTAHYNDE